jgi:hypothetical protein
VTSPEALLDDPNVRVAFAAIESDLVAESKRGFDAREPSSDRGPLGSVEVERSRILRDVLSRP